MVSAEDAQRRDGHLVGSGYRMDGLQNLIDMLGCGKTLRSGSIPSMLPYPIFTSSYQLESAVSEKTKETRGGRSLS